MFLEFFIWWYGKGWAKATKNSLGLIKKIQLSFSIPRLLKFLFAPWKQIISAPGSSIDDKFRALIDNLISRTVGFFVRLFALMAALILTASAAVTGLIMMVSWPLVIPLIIVCIFKGIVG